MLHRRLGVGGSERRRRLRRGRDGAPAPQRPAGRGSARATTTATSNSTGSTRIPAPMSSRSRPPATGRRRSRRSSASASISARSGCRSVSSAPTRSWPGSSPRKSADPGVNARSWIPGLRGNARRGMTPLGGCAHDRSVTISHLPCARPDLPMPRAVGGSRAARRRRPLAGPARAAQHLRILSDHRRAREQSHRAGGAARPRRLPAGKNMGAGDLGRAARRRAAAGAWACSRARRRSRS